MRCCLNYLGDFPKMIQILQAFGERSSFSSEGSGAYSCRKDSAGHLQGQFNRTGAARSLTKPDCCYILRCIEEDKPSEENKFPWSIRQFAVHEQRKDPEKESTFFLIKRTASQSLNQRMKAVRDGSAVPQKAAHVHTLFASAAAVRWSSYASVLESRLHELVRPNCFLLDTALG
jgi:hypothetical protein